MQRLGVCGPEDGSGFLEQAQVHEAGRENQQRLDVAGIGGDPGAVACGLTQKFERFADPAFVPADQRAGDMRRRDGRAVVLVGGGEDSGCYAADGLIVAHPGGRLQVCADRVVPEGARQLRLGQHGLRVADGIARLAAQAPDRRQNAPQARLRGGLQRLGQGVMRDPGSLVPAGPRR